MHSAKILITHWVHNEIIDYLSQFGELITNQTKHSLDRGKLIEYAREADAIMAFMPDSIDESFLEHCPNLKIVGAALKGYDNFDVDACTRRGIWFSIVPDHLTIPTAELAIGLMISVGRNMLQGDRMIRNGHFPGWRPVLYGRGIAGSTVGILGMGAVGQAIARLLVPFGCRSLYYDIEKLPENIEEEVNSRFSPLDELYNQSDYVIVALPLNEGTAGFVDSEAIAKFKLGSLLINVGRGSCVDEEAVANALKNGQLGGYGADVFAFEDWIRADRPEMIEPQLTGCLDTTFLTPHIGSAVEQVRRDIAMQAAVNIVEALQGKRPHGAINEIHR